MDRPSSDPLRIGIVGAGNISGIYLTNLAAFPGTEVVALADLDLDRARAVAQKHGVPNALETETLLAHPDVDLVLNLTIPAAHADVARRAVAHGKHAYNEKPLAVELDDARALMAEADAKGLRVGCAPDTFLSAGQQRSRRLIEEGRIGTPVLAHAFMMSTGPESWHPSPEFFYKRGGGPLLDMGPYYITAFVNLFGPIKSVTAATRATWNERTIGSEPMKGQKIRVETPTTIVGTLEFHSGPIAQLTTTFDAGGNFPNITVFGDEGHLIVPDPNNFDGPTLLSNGGTEEKIETKLPFAKNSRGLGVVDIAYAVKEGRPHRASGALALHVLEAMLGLLRSGEEGRRIEIESDPGPNPLVGEDEFPAERPFMDAEPA